METKEDIEQMAKNHAIMNYTPTLSNKQSIYIMEVSSNSFIKGFQTCQELQESDAKIKDNWVDFNEKLMNFTKDFVSDIGFAPHPIDILSWLKEHYNVPPIQTI